MNRDERPRVPWILAFARMTKTTRPSFRARPQAATRNPGTVSWIPACAGMTAGLVSADVLSAQHSGQLSMTILADRIGKGHAL